MNKYTVGDTVFLIESNRIVREVNILKAAGGFYTVKFVNGGGGIKVRESRLFTTREEAEASVPNLKSVKSLYYHSPWN